MSTAHASDNASVPPADVAGQLTAENRSVDVAGATLAYRRFGNPENEAPPLLCLQHFRGNLDNWDPALVDRLADDRDVILLDNRGVGGSTGVVPDNVADMAATHCVSSTRSGSGRSICSASRSAATSPRTWRWCGLG